MNLYGLDSSLFEFGFNDPSLIESISSSHSMITDRRYIEREEDNLLKLSNSILKNIKRASSPPKHRHDGTSPLPLGMDWSPPPRNWGGVNTIWPHDFHTGWSYCVTVPSWSMLAESRGSELVVFYRVQVGLQSPEGATSTRGVLRRFSDFLKLSSDLKQSFRNKKFPPAPPKGLLRMKNRTLLEERRCFLEEWMSQVLSDIDVSRSVPVACFLELEAAARSSFRESSHDEVGLSCKSSSSSDPISSQNDISVAPGTSAWASNSGSGSTSETSESRSDLYVKDNYSESDEGNPVLENNSVSPVEATVNEAFSENNNATLSKEFGEGKEEKNVHKPFNGRINLDKIHTCLSSTLSHHHDSVENRPDQENLATVSHPKGLSREIPQGCTTSAAANENSTSWDVHQDNGKSSKFSGSVETSAAIDTLDISDMQVKPDTLVVLPLDEQQKVSRLLTNMQQRLVTSKTDIDDLIARLNQEVAVRLYLTTKVKDLETELESSKQIGKENLEQALSIERERFTQLQWDMQELRREGMEMELRMKAEQVHIEEEKASIIKEKEALRLELDSAREQLKNLQKFNEEADLKSKSDVKLLVKEVKSLRTSQSELKQECDRVSNERIELKTSLQKERAKRDCIDAANRKLLHECEILRSRLKECGAKFLVEQEYKLKMESPPDAMDVLATSENRISLLLAEAQLLAQEVATPVSSDLMTIDDELRKMLTDVFIDNAILRKQANSIIHCALDATHTSPKEDDAPSRTTVISKFFDL
ncbi:PX domain-containing protein EREL2-like isoform X2 [Salvia miltiorrhiza]|uniref:PX domain-containing protein EREL2-like isoform X2 n=1 Tax=Salvia miltiorrhiza TaxID=226208 RepID=UPI0025AD0738|nr:PX domain-containing protein EREL2-like isoform X2 [Salvia miltiorrhiza]